MTRSTRPAFSNRREIGLLMPIIACFLYFVARAPFLGQWDSFDYLKQIVTHQLSDLGFGRPVFIGYNVLLWEGFRWALDLEALQSEAVIMGGMILSGALGVLLFYRLALQLLSGPAARLAALALLLSPLYAIYSGSVMSEVPMLVVLIAAGLTIAKAQDRNVARSDIVAGILFGLAVGIREQAMTLCGAFFWLLWIRRPDAATRKRSFLRFGVASLIAALAPPALLFLRDPPGFTERILNWWQIIPTGGSQAAGNLQAILLYAFLLCPAAWVALSVALVPWRRRRAANASGKVDGLQHSNRPGIPIPGVVCAIMLPLAILLKDADVQIHPRYVLIILPAAAILCAGTFHSLRPTRRAAVSWALLHVIVFGLAQLALQPFRQIQAERREWSGLVRELVPGEALLIAGAYSPVFDYYRAVGERPGWKVLWSGWEWSEESVVQEIRESWSCGRPVLLCDGPAAWLLFEEERLHLHHILLKARKKVVGPGLWEILPMERLWMCPPPALQDSLRR